MLGNGLRIVFQNNNMEKFIKENSLKIVIIVVVIILFSLTLQIFLDSVHIKNKKQNETSVGESVIKNTAKTQLANPASVNCIEKGGKLSIIDKPEGQVGMCTLSDGAVCEEWTYLRGECQKNN